MVEIPNRPASISVSRLGWYADKLEERILELELLICDIPTTALVGSGMLVRVDDEQQAIRKRPEW